MSRLEVLKGPSRGKVFRLSKMATIGRSLDATIRFDDLTLSREHARIILDERGGAIIEDLRSGNGTFVNGVRVESARLSDEDVIALGQSVAVFRVGEQSSSSSAARMTMLSVDDQESDSSVVNTLDMYSASVRHKGQDESSMEDLLSANKCLNILYDMYRSIGTNLDEEVLLEKILDTLFHIFPETQRGFIILRDQNTGELTPRAARVLGPEQENRLNVSQAIVRYLLEQKQAVLSKDVMRDQRFGESQSLIDMGVRSIMCAPLMKEDEVLGFISLDTQDVGTRYDDDGLALLVGIATQAGLAISNARMHAQLVERERLNQDLRNASRIQHSFLPQSPPVVPGYEFADWYCAAEEVGGDFYDFISLPDGRLAVVVGDVSGKGVPAALMMAKTSSHVRFQAASGASPGRIMAEINRALAGAENEMFVTVLLAVLDTEENAVTVANAGHLAPILRRADGTAREVGAESGFPVGLLKDAKFPETSIRIEPGDRLCLFTDGITEAMSVSKEQYGRQRLVGAVEAASASAEGIVLSIRESVATHTKGATQSDDVTLVCFGHLGGGETVEGAEHEEVAAAIPETP